MLQKLTPITFPFVRQFIAFALIATRMRNDDVFRTIRAAARKRNDVIYLIAIWIELFVTPVALTMLPLVLTLYICGSVFTAGLLFSCISLHVVSAVRCVVSLPMGNSPFAPTFQNPFGMSLSILSRSCLLLFRMLFSEVARANFLFGANLIDMSVSVSIRPLAITCFTEVIKAIWTGMVSGKLVVGSSFTAITANLGIIHSASLSLNLKMSPAGGEIIRFSGATLADNANYTAERSQKPMTVSVNATRKDCIKCLNEGGRVVVNTATYTQSSHVKGLGSAHLLLNKDGVVIAPIHWSTARWLAHNGYDIPSESDVKAVKS